MLGDADAGVVDPDGDPDVLGAGGCGPHLEPDLARGGELDGIAEQVDQDLAQPARVAPHQTWQVGRDLDGKGQTFGRRARGDQGAHPVDRGSQIELDLVQLQPAGLHPGQVQDIVDDRQQRLAGLVHRLDIALLLVAERRLEQQPRHA